METKRVNLPFLLPYLILIGAEFPPTRFVARKSKGGKKPTVTGCGKRMNGNLILLARYELKAAATSCTRIEQ